jgi:hypothetical protein
MVQEIRAIPLEAWRRISLQGVSRLYKTPRILDRKIRLKDYRDSLREIVAADLGHEEPTVLLTNQLSPSAHRLIERYAQRMLIENNIADGIDFFHMDALSSAVAMKVNLDLQLTLMASSLYRMLGAKWAAATNGPGLGTFFGTWSMPRLRSRSAPGRSLFGIKKGLIIRCSSPPGSIKSIRPCRGWPIKKSTLSLAEGGVVLSQRTNMGIQANPGR